MPTLDRKGILYCLSGMIFTLVFLNAYNSHRWMTEMENCIHQSSESVTGYHHARSMDQFISEDRLVSEPLPMVNNHTGKVNITGTPTAAPSYKQTRSNHPMDKILDSIHLEWHPRDRKDRFPSVEERVKIYMGNWYYPRCMNTTPINFTIQYTNDSCPFLTVYGVDGVGGTGDKDKFDSIIVTDREFILHQPTIAICANHDETVSNLNSRITRCEPNYSKDGLDILKIAEEFEIPQIDKNTTNQSLISTPFIVLFGDEWPKSRTLPLFSKYRGAATRENLLKVINPDLKCNSTLSDDRFLKIVKPRKWQLNANIRDIVGLPYYQPIVWNFNGQYNFGRDVQNTLSSDIPWEAKKTMCAYWTGNMNGPRLWPTSIPTPNQLDICLSNARCTFVYNHANSSIVHASLMTYEHFFKMGYINETINGVHLTGSWLQLKDFLSCKVVISFEGNDASTSLKWQLLSNSVVIMPRPTITSWHMEEFLEPWVHYIPIREDGSDAEQMIEWVANNDEQARRIAERGTLYMYDFLYHPQAEDDDRLVKREIIRRHHQFWH